MAFNLTQTTKNLSQQLPVRPVLILEIDGISLSFGTDVVTKSWFFDEGESFDTGLFFDSTVADVNSRPYIDLDNGTTKVLTSQVNIEDGGSGSVQKFNVRLVDTNNEVSRLLTPGVEVDDPLTRTANIYLNFVGGAHKEDSVRIFTGIISSIKPGAGYVDLNIAHPDELKRQDIFQQNTAKIDGAIDDTVTTITLKDQTFDFLEPTSIFKTFIVLEDEIIEYTGISGDDLTGCVRGSLSTFAVAHDDEAELVSFYTLSGAPLTLALQIMMSNRDDAIATGSVANINQVTATQFVANSIYISDLFFADDNGLEEGELLSITGSINPANDITDIEILNISISEDRTGTILILDTILVTEIGDTGTLTIKSQFNVLPDGLGMSHAQVDIKQHQDIEEQYGNQLTDYEFFIKDTIDAKDFLAKQIYFPVGLYSVIRKARASVQITVPPLNTNTTVNLTSDNVLNPDKIAPERTINKYMFNNITYKYNLDSLTDKYLAGDIRLSARSSNRIKVGNKVLQITSDGLRDNATTTQFITRQSRRFTERFQFAAELIKVTTNFKTGFNIEVGDGVFFGDTGLKVYDSTSGTRDFKPRLMEVINKSFSIAGANVTLTLLDMQYSSDARYGVISPSSFIDAGSTTTSIKIKKSFTTGVFDLERSKWADLIGETIRIRSEDFTFTEDVTLLSFDPTDDTKITVSPALSLSPSEDYLVDLTNYQNSGDITKGSFVFATPQVDIVSGTNGLIFEVGAGDISKFFVGGFLRVHNEDFSVDSTPTLAQDDLEIVDITVNTITVNRGMGFTPTTSEVVSLIGFSSDNGLPYRFT